MQKYQLQDRDDSDYWYNEEQQTVNGVDVALACEAMLEAKLNSEDHEYIQMLKRRFDNYGFLDESRLDRLARMHAKLMESDDA